MKIKSTQQFCIICSLYIFLYPLQKSSVFKVQSVFSTATLGYKVAGKGAKSYHMAWVTRGMHAWHVMPKVSTQVYVLDCKICKLFEETGKKGQNVISSSVQHPISLIFAIHVSFIVPLPMMWILLTKPMQKYVTTVCLRCSFAGLKNKLQGPQ